MEISLVNQITALQNQMNSIHHQNQLTLEIQKTIAQPNNNLFGLLFFSPQIGVSQYQFAVYFLKNKLSDLKKTLGADFSKLLFNEIVSFFFQELSNEQKTTVSQQNLQEMIKKMTHLKDLFDRSSNEVEDVLILQIVQRLSKVLLDRYLSKWKILMFRLSVSSRKQRVL